MYGALFLVTSKDNIFLDCSKIVTSSAQLMLPS